MPCSILHVFLASSYKRMNDILLKYLAVIYVKQIWKYTPYDSKVLT